jgi:magnesium chelatase family protein
MLSLQRPGYALVVLLTGLLAGPNDRGFFMLAKTFSFGLNGLEAYPVTIEVDVARGLPSMTIVGLPDSAIKESRERVRSAIRNAGFEFPCGRITVNLAPADIKKEGPSFDLAIALGILAAAEKAPAGTLRRFILLGELSLSGQIKTVSGVLPIALATPKTDFDGIIIPQGNAEEAALAKTAPAHPFRHLNEVVAFLQSPEQCPAFVPKDLPGRSFERHPDEDFLDVKGHSFAKRGLEIAAAGGHNVLLIGPPGSGKTMLARRFPTVLPSMTREESLEVSRIYSVAEPGSGAKTLIQRRPFRSPHHTASHVALVGGGADPRAGEVTLAHHGVLFLDEFPEFSRQALESLRQPMEDGFVTVARAAKTLRFPAKFTLLAAMNPCPCGYLTDRKRTCHCSGHAIHKYLNKISGPLLDRIDIHLEVPALKTAELLHAPAGETSEMIRERVEAARQKQLFRLKAEGTFANAQMTHKQLKRLCPLTSEGERLLKQAVDELGFSARAYDKIRKVARTISDLSGHDDIRPEHLAEAIGYRCLDKTNV